MLLQACYMFQGMNEKNRSHGKKRNKPIRNKHDDLYRNCNLSNAYKRHQGMNSSSVLFQQESQRRELLALSFLHHL